MLRINNGATVRLICGEVLYDGQEFIGPGTSVAGSPICISHAHMPPSSSLSFTVPSNASVLIYVQSGGSPDEISESPQGLQLSKYDLLKFDCIDKNSNSDTQIVLNAGDVGMDALVLAGLPLREPIVWSGPVVEASEESYLLSQSIFKDVAEVNGFWNHKLNDEEWRQHITELDLQRLIKSAKEIE